MMNDRLMRVIACQMVGEELKTLLPGDVPCTILEFGLHLTPEKLNVVLQKEIDATQEGVDTILGFGLCSKGALGLRARGSRLVIPRVDDCIALFLGSKQEYLRQHSAAPGTYYLTKGWIECGSDPYTEYLKMADKYGEERALWMESQIMHNYTRVALIVTAGVEERHRQYARKVAAFLNLVYEELPGSNVLLRRLVAGDWDSDFVVVEPGGKTELNDFLAL